MDSDLIQTFTKLTVGEQREVIGLLVSPMAIVYFATRAKYIRLMDARLERKDRIIGQQARDYQVLVAAHATLSHVARDSAEILAGIAGQTVAITTDNRQLLAENQELTRKLNKKKSRRNQHKATEAALDFVGLSRFFKKKSDSDDGSADENDKPETIQ